MTRFNKITLHNVRSWADIINAVPFGMEQCVNVELALVDDSAVCGEDGTRIDVTIRRVSDGREPNLDDSLEEFVELRRELGV